MLDLSKRGRTETVLQAPVCHRGIFIHDLRTEDMCLDSMSVLLSLSCPARAYDELLSSLEVHRYQSNLA
jgi:hypothetical protein